MNEPATDNAPAGPVPARGPWLKPGQRIFHGTRCRFERFDARFHDTGEASVGFGFYFTDSPQGAARHATTRLGSAPGEPLVYACSLRPGSLVLNPMHTIADHPPEEQAQWWRMPAAYAWSDTGHRQGWIADWLPALAATLAQDRLAGRHRTADKDRSGLAGASGGGRDAAAPYRLLKQMGFSAIFDAEGGFTDHYLGGVTILVLNEGDLIIHDVMSADLILGGGAGAIGR